VLTATSAKIRLVSDIADIMFDMQGGTFSVSTPSPADGLPIQQHLRMNKLQRLLMHGGKIEIRIEHKLMASGTFQSDKFNLEPEHILSAQRILRHLERMISHAGAEDIPMAIPAINDQIPQVGMMAGIISGVARTSDISFKATVANNGLQNVGNSEILMLTHLHFGRSCIVTAALGKSTITGEGVDRIITISGLRARRVETIDNDSTAITAFRQAMQAETGIDFVLDIGSSIPG
jgi:hypothetical protein